MAVLDGCWPIAHGELLIIIENLEDCCAGGAGPGAGITVLDTFSIDLSGDGTAGTPLSADAKISIQAGNQLTLRTGTNPGLYVADPLGSGSGTITVIDTTSINLEGDGSLGDPLEAALILSPDADNTAAVQANGLYSTLRKIDTRTNLLALQTGGTLVTGRWYELTETKTIAAITGVKVMVMAAAPNRFSNAALMIHPNFAETAWPTIYDIVSDTLVEVKDHRGNIVQGAEAIAEFPFHFMTYTKLTVRGGAASSFSWSGLCTITNTIFDHPSSITLTGFTGTIQDCHFGPSAIVILSSSGTPLLSQVEVTDATLIATDLVGSILNTRVADASVMTASGAEGVWQWIEVIYESTLNISFSTVGGEHITAQRGSMIVLTGKTAGTLADVYVVDMGQLLAGAYLGNMQTVRVSEQGYVALSSSNCAVTSLNVRQSGQLIATNVTGGSLTRNSIDGAAISLTTTTTPAVTDNHVTSGAILTMNTATHPTITNNTFDNCTANFDLSVNIIVTQNNVSHGGMTGKGGVLTRNEVSGGGAISGPLTAATTEITDNAAHSSGSINTQNATAGRVRYCTVNSGGQIDADAASFTGDVEYCDVSATGWLDVSNAAHVGLVQYASVRSGRHVEAAASVGISHNFGIHAGSGTYTYTVGANAANVRDQD